MIDTKIEEIAKRKGFTNFWEVFDYTLVAGYNELDALKISLELFKGNIWDDVISFNSTPLFHKEDEDDFIIDEPVPTPADNFVDYVLEYNQIVPRVWNINGDLAPNETTPINEPDNLNVVVYIMTSDYNPVYKALYKAYIETRKYLQISELDKNIKEIKLILKTELAIEMFKNKVI